MSAKHHNPDTCPTCGPYVNTAAYARGVARGKALDVQRVTGER